MKQYFLTKVNGKEFIMLNPFSKLTNNQCNSQIFKNQEEAGLEVDIFKHFQAKVEILQKLDLRTKFYKNLRKEGVGFFSVNYLVK